MSIVGWKFLQAIHYHIFMTRLLNQKNQIVKHLLRMRRKFIFVTLEISKDLLIYMN